MKAIYILLILGMLSPGVAFAQVVSTTESEVDTGGNTVDSGGVIGTGSAGSAVKTTNVVGSEGGTVDVKIETTVNGKTQTETVQKEVSGGSVRVEVSAGASTGGGTQLPARQTSVPKLDVSPSVFGSSSVSIFSNVSSTSGWTNFLPWLSRPWFKETIEEEVAAESDMEEEISEDEGAEPRGFWARFVEKLRLVFWFQ